MRVKFVHKALLFSIVLSVFAMHSAVAAAPTYMVTGRVVNQTGLPVVDAEVICATEPSNGLTVTRTEMSGRFSIDFDAKVTCYLLVGAKGYAPALHAIPADVMQTQVTIKLSPGHRIEGTLRNDIGKPVAGVHISPVIVSISGLSAEEQSTYSSLFRNLQRRTQSAKDGHFVIPDLPDAQITLEVEEEGYLSLQQRAIPLDIPQQITLRRRGKICGRIVRNSDGKPVKNFYISIDGGSHGVSDSPDGSFCEYQENDEPHSGGVTLQVTAVGYRRTTMQHLSYSPDAKPIVIRLSQAGKATGQITERGTGKPLSGVLVTVFHEFAGNYLSPHAGSFGIPPAKARTDVHGRFTVEARVASATVTLQKPGYGRVVLEDVDLGKPLHVSLEKGGWLMGKALDDAGKPLANCWVSVSTIENGREYFQGQTKADGSYTVTDLPSGAYSVSENNQRTTTVLVKSGQTTTVDWHRDTGITVRGTVALSDGKVGRLRVRLMSVRLDALFETVTDQQGHYSISPLAVGDYYLDVTPHADDQDSMVNTIMHGFTVHSGENVCDVKRLGTVSGQLMDMQSGKPMSKTPIHAFLRSTMHDFYGFDTPFLPYINKVWCPANGVTTDEQGNFTIQNLLPGEYMIVQGKNPWESGPVVVPPFTLQENEHKTGVLAQLPPLGSAQITVVDAESGKVIPEAPVLCVDKWGNVIRPQLSNDDHTAQQASVFPELTEGEYRVFSDNRFGFAEYVRNYPTASTSFSVSAGKSTAVQLPMKRDGRLVLRIERKQSGKDHIGLSYGITDANTLQPVLSDAYGTSTGGALVIPPEVKEVPLALPSGRYHMTFSLFKITQPVIAFSMAVTTLRKLPEQDIEITPGKDTVLTFTF